MAGIILLSDRIALHRLRAKINFGPSANEVNLSLAGDFRLLMANSETMWIFVVFLNNVIICLLI